MTTATRSRSKSRAPRTAQDPCAQTGGCGASTPAGGASTAKPPATLARALAALALGGFAIGTTEFVAMGLLPEISRGVGISVPAGGHVISAYALGVVVGAPLLAGLGARFPRRTLHCVTASAGVQSHRPTDPTAEPLPVDPIAERTAHFAIDPVDRKGL